MSLFGLAQIPEVIVYFFIRNVGECFCFNLNLERGKQCLGNSCRNQPSLLFSSSNHVIGFFFFCKHQDIVQKQNNKKTFKDVFSIESASNKNDNYLLAY